MASKIAQVLLAILLLALSAMWFGMDVPVIVLAILSGAAAVAQIAALLVPAS